MERQCGQYRISAEESERIQRLKIWFTIMVLFIHAYADEVHFTTGDVTLQVPVWLDWVKYIVSQVITRCAVPGYFFISAVLLYKKEFTWAENIKKKLKTLLIPYLILNTAWIIIYFAAQQIAVFAPYFSKEERIISHWGLVQYLDAYLGFQTTYPILYPLWFIRDLMALNLLAVVIKRLVDRFPRLMFAALVLMVALNIQTHLFFLNQQALVFFCLGYYFVKYSVSFHDAEKIKAPVLVTAYLAAVALDALTRGMAINYLPHFASMLVGMVFFYRFTTKISPGRLHDALMYIARYSFPIYLFHEMNLTILKKLLTKMLPQTALWQTLLYFGIPIVIFCLCLLLSILLDKYFHKIYLVLVGSRSR